MTSAQRKKLLRRLYEVAETLPMAVYDALAKHTDSEGVIHVSLKDLLRDAAASVGMQEPEE